MKAVASVHIFKISLATRPYLATPLDPVRRVGCLVGCRRGTLAKRRGHGEGSVYQRSRDGRWCGVVDLGRGPDGKRRRRTVIALSRTESPHTPVTKCLPGPPHSSHGPPGRSRLPRNMDVVRTGDAAPHGDVQPLACGEEEMA